MCQLSNLFQLFIDYVIVIDYENEINMKVFSKRVTLNHCIGCIQLYTTVYSCNAKYVVVSVVYNSFFNSSELC